MIIYRTHHHRVSLHYASFAGVIFLILFGTDSGIIKFSLFITFTLKQLLTRRFFYGQDPSGRQCTDRFIMLSHAQTSEVCPTVLVPCFFNNMEKASTVFAWDGVAGGGDFCL